MLTVISRLIADNADIPADQPSTFEYQIKRRMNGRAAIHQQRIRNACSHP